MSTCNQNVTCEGVEVLQCYIMIDTWCWHYYFEHNRYVWKFENDVGIVGTLLGIIGEISHIEGVNLTTNINTVMDSLFS